MDHQGQAATPAAALRRIVAVDDALLAVEYEESQLHVQELRVDAATRVVRSGARKPVAFPVSMPADVAWVAAACVQATELAVPLTLLVFRVAAEESDGDSDRPAKRVRRDTKTKTAATATRLLFFSLWRGGDWQLAPVGDVVLPGTDLSVHVADGPYVVAHSSATNELSLLSFTLNDDGEYMFQVVRSGLSLPRGRRGERVKSLVSCQFVDAAVSPTPHLLIQFTRTEKETQSQSDAALTTWTPSDEQRHWATLSLGGDSDEASAGPAITSCSYLPAKWLADDPLRTAERITSVAFVGLEAHVALKDKREEDAAIQLHPSDVLLLGTSAGVLHVISNDVPLASYVFTGAPHSIRVINATDGGMGDEPVNAPLIVAVHCADSDRSFQLLSIDYRRHPGRAIKPLQHFTFVGAALPLPPASTSSTDVSLVLLNDLSTTVDAGFVERSLRKSVIVSADWSTPAAATSSCHRLKYRSEEKKPKQKKKKQGDDELDDDDRFQCIERIKLDRRDPDLDSDNRKSTASSSASEQQLLALAKSLDERLRIGREQHQRLERIGADKLKTVMQLNSLLVGRSDHVQGRRTHKSHAEALEMVPVVLLESDESTTSSPVAYPPERGNPHTRPVLEASSVQHFERSTSTLQLQVTVRFPRHVEDAITAVRSISVFPRDAVVALRSSSIVHHAPSSEEESNVPSHRVSFDVNVELPVQYVFARSASTLGLWLSTEIDQNQELPVTTTPSSVYLGDVEIDPHVLTASQNTVAVHGGFKKKSSNSSTPDQDHLLLLSGGSSLRDVLHNLQSTLGGLSLTVGVVRQRFATVQLPSAALDTCALGQLLDALPDDVIALANPLTSTSVSSVLELIRSLQLELQQLQMLENNADDTQATRTQLVQTQAKTDQLALRVLNEWQRRMNFHAVWGSKTAASLISSTHT